MESNCINIVKIIKDKLYNGAIQDIHDNDYIAKQVVVDIINSVKKELSEILVYNDTDSVTSNRINFFKFRISKI